MTQRLNIFEKGNKGIQVLFGIGAHLSKSSVAKSLLELIYFRVSQINGCAYCLDMHSKDLRAKGETEQRLYMLAAWPEASLYTAREKAALAYAEALTSLQHGVTDSVYNDVAAHFSDDELIDLTIGITTINTYNRLNIAFGTPAGNYQPGQHAGAVATAG